MKGKSQINSRRSIRLKDYDYSKPGAYFVTICTKGHKNIFGNVVDSGIKLNELGKIVSQYLYDLPNHYPHVKLDKFIIMPNHIHGIFMLVGAGFKPPPTINKKRHGLTEIIRAFKTFSSRKINKLYKISGTSVWQRNYYERIVRDEDELNKIRQYISDNPIKWELDKENPDSIMIEDKVPWES